MANKTFKLFADKMGGRNASEYIGVEGEVFYDPSIPSELRVSDGESPGGVFVSSRVASTVGITNGGNLTPLDLNKSVQIIEPISNWQAYSLADGVEGQIMYFVPSVDTDTEYAGVVVANARWTNANGIVNQGTNQAWLPFRGTSASAVQMAIFTNGYWNLSSNQFD